MDINELEILSGTDSTFKKKLTKVFKLKALNNMNTISEENESHLLNNKSPNNGKTNYEKLPLLNTNLKNSQIIKKNFKNVNSKEKKNYFTPDYTKNIPLIEENYYRRSLNAHPSETKNKIFGMRFNLKFDNFDRYNSNPQEDISNSMNETSLNQNNNSIIAKKSNTININKYKPVRNIKVKIIDKKIQPYFSQKKILNIGTLRIGESRITKENEKIVIKSRNINLNNNNNFESLFVKSNNNSTFKNYNSEKKFKDSIEINSNNNSDIKKFLNLNYNSTSNFHIKSDSKYIYYYLVLPGNNAKLIEDCILTRKNWEQLPQDSKECRCNLLFTPLSGEIDYLLHKNIYLTHVVNHFENHSELSNKKNLFINLLRYCELHNKNLFQFFPLTIILSLTQKNLESQLEGFKKFYTDLPNLTDNDENSNKLEKNYSDYFSVNLSKQVGSRQKILIPKTHYKGYNIWLIKRANFNRGRQIHIMSNVGKLINEIKKIKNETNLHYLLLQKYIEDPLLYNLKKFDIRIWVLFTYMFRDEKYEFYVFKEGHLKSCSENFNIVSNNLYVHLTNYSVQKYNENFSKDDIGNEISYEKFQNFLNQKSKKVNFKEDILTNIIHIIEITVNATKNKINIMDRKNCFEIFGYDFILDKDYNPFLLEINTNPGFEESSPLIKMLVPRMIDDAFRLTIDKLFERKENDQYRNKSKFHVDGYEDDENMWQKIKFK